MIVFQTSRALRTQREAWYESKHGANVVVAAQLDNIKTSREET